MLNIQDFILLSPSSNKKDTTKFIKMILYLQNIEHFKHAVNLALTACKEKRLRFNICTHLMQDNRHGLCETLCIPLHKKILNKAFYKNQYQISIKKLKYSTIIHEIFHMVEKELQLDLQSDFMPVIQQDLPAIKSKANILIKKKLDSLMSQDLRLYNRSQYNSEIFARYFELFAAAKDISGEESIYTPDLKKLFKNTQSWVVEKLVPNLGSRVAKELICIDIAKREYKNKIQAQSTTWQTKSGAEKTQKWTNVAKSNFE